MNFARISEIFCSIQGEGLYAGQKQVFVRFAGCGLNCAYCDEPAAAGSGKRMSVERAGKAIARVSGREKASAVSFTGGEPLLQAAAVKELASFSRRLGLKVHLETNGIHYRELAEVLDEVDVIAADIKLPGSCGAVLWREHRRFLALAPERTFVKVVVTSGTTAAEFRKAVDIAAAAGRRMPFFIQPVTPDGPIKPPAAGALGSFYRAAAGKLENVRIMPQLHPLWGVK